MKKKKMLLAEAYRKLARAREQEKESRHMVAKYKLLVEDLGGDLNQKRGAMIARNKQLYKEWKDGKRFKQLANEFKLSPGTVSSICNRIEIMLERKITRFNEYSDLLPFK